MTNVPARDRRTGDATLEEVATRRRRLARDRLPGGQRLAPGQPRRPTRRRGRRSTELGYVPNRAARSLVTRRSDSIARRHHRADAAALFSDPFFPRLLRGISARAGRARPPARPAHAGRPQRDAAHRATTSPPATSTARCSSASTTTTPSPAGIAAAGIPIVVVGATAARPRRSSYVDVDNRGGAHSARRATSSTGGRRVDRHDRRPAGHGRRRRTASPATAMPCRRRASAPTRALEAVARLHPGRRRRRRWSSCSPHAPTSTPCSPRRT